MNNKEIGKRIRERREELGLTKSDVASQIKVAASTIKRYEDGEIEKIKIPVIGAIAKTLRVNPMWLTGRSKNKEVAENQYNFELEDTYFSFAKEMQKKNVSKEDMEKLWRFYDMIKKK